MSCPDGSGAGQIAAASGAERQRVSGDAAIDAAIDAGQAVYSRKSLALYDLWVLGFSNRLLWRCPTARLRKLFADNATTNHLDVGVGSGYFLDRCLPPGDRRLALVD